MESFKLFLSLVSVNQIKLLNHSKNFKIIIIELTNISSKKILLNQFNFLLTIFIIQSYLFY